MVTIVTNPFGQERNQQLARVEEYAFIIFIGKATATTQYDDLLNIRNNNEDENFGEVTSEVATPTEKIRWEWLLRGGADALRKNSPNLFFPVFVDEKKISIHSIGEPLPLGIDRNTINVPQGCIAVWPIKTNGIEGRWRCSVEYLKNLVDKGCARVGEYDKKNNRYSILYLSKATMKRIESGEIQILGKDNQAALVLGKAEKRQQYFSVKTVWNRSSHRAGEWGTRYIREMLPGRQFSFPKSLYAVKDTLNIFVSNKKDALILDFFAGSGTTLHAVNLLNAEDGGNRRCILVTNNEVSLEEAKNFEKKGIQEGSDEWNALGIARFVTWPRTRCSILGENIKGEALKGNYLGSDRPMSEGFSANAIFFKLGFLDKTSVALGKQLQELISILWLKAGAIGECPPAEANEKYMIYSENNFAVLVDPVYVNDFKENLSPNIEVVYIITDYENEFNNISAFLNIKKSYQLYKDYLENFKINGRDRF